MPGFALYCRRPESAPAPSDPAAAMAEPLLRSRNALSNLAVERLERPGEHTLLKLEAPHAEPKGIFRAQDD